MKSGDVVDLCSSGSSPSDSEDADDRPRYRGYATYAVGSPLDDAALRGPSKLLTLESARQAVHLVAQFARDEASAGGVKGASSVTFIRSLFDPLWQRLKAQGCGKDGHRWRSEPTRGKLPSRSYAFVPPRSKLGTKGKTGEDYYLSEAHVARVVLSEISAIKGVSNVYSENAHYFLLILPILERAVAENVQYEVARRDRKGGRGARGCNYNSFNIDCDLVASSDGSSEGEKSNQGKRKNSPSSAKKLAKAARGKEASSSSDGKLHESNLSGVEPKVNMPVDVLEKGFIWNIGKIVQVSYQSDGKGRGQGGNATSSPRKCYVTVHYDGWGKKWDETIQYPSERVTRIFAYTKKVKCLVPILDKRMRGLGNLPSNARNWTEVWPCRVSFRMPHPGNALASDYLRSERSIYIEPYSVNMLPPTVRQQYTGGGRWIPANRLMQWESLCLNNHATTSVGELIHNNIQPATLVAEGFCKAYHSAQSDWIKGHLPPDVLSKGTLLKDEYRVHDVGGTKVNGAKYSGSFHSGKEKKEDQSSAHGLNQQHSSAAKGPAFSTINPLDPASSSLPQPIPVIDPLILEKGTRWLPHSKRWAGVLCVAGNDVFLGSYKSQSEAANAVSIALAKSRAEAGFASNGKGEIDALFNTPIDAIVSSFERTQRPLPSRFRLQDWVSRSGQDTSFSVNLKSDGSSGQKRRRKSVPKRLHKK